ncbi:MAG: tetratricopeptide repeat protein [Actinobacteria bacterium]|nr:tetratricopeptide repeat protein [Actinomycetota bacterium]
MPLDTTETDFERDVVERSKQVPVVVDFWAEWCGPCRQLGPALEAAESKRGGDVVLAKVDVDSNQALAARFGVQGIPAVKAFRDGKIVDEFVGAVPPAKVEAFFDGLAPSRADQLLAAGDELSLREASELEPRRADIALALARARLARGAEAEALEAIQGFPDDFAAAGIAARVRLVAAGVAPQAWSALDGGNRTAALDTLLESLSQNGDAAGEMDPTERRDLIRKAIIGVLADLDPADPTAREYRRKLSAAL